MHLNNQPIEQVPSAKFLGIRVSSNLSWNLQVDHICKKARRTIGYIHSHHSSHSLSGAFAPFWNMVALPGTLWTNPWPTGLNQVRDSPAVLSCSRGMILMKIFSSDLIDLTLLSKRRDIAKLCHLHKIVHNLCSSSNPYKPHPRSTFRNLNSFALAPPFCRLTLSQRSFYPYALSLWRKSSNAGLCDPLRQLFTHIWCRCVCSILFCLVLFRFSFCLLISFVFGFGHVPSFCLVYFGIPLIYGLFNIGFCVAVAECYKYIRPCAVRSCHNRDMPKISSKYAFAHLQWHNLKSVHHTIVKVYVFGKLFLQEIQKWFYICGRGKSKNIMADQKLNFF